MRDERYSGIPRITAAVIDLDNPRPRVHLCLFLAEVTDFLMPRGYPAHGILSNFSFERKRTSPSFMRVLCVWEAWVMD